jgi:hypothetical protein
MSAKKQKTAKTRCAIVTTTIYVRDLGRTPLLRRRVSMRRLGRCGVFTERARAHACTRRCPRPSMPT